MIFHVSLNELNPFFSEICDGVNGISGVERVIDLSVEARLRRATAIAEYLRNLISEDIESPDVAVYHEPATMTCDLCTTDDGLGIHYHAFISGKHYWICERCKIEKNLQSEHEDD
jgi:hypothetical protein